MTEHRRIRREKQTIAAMLRIFCRGVHLTPSGLCASCRELMEYAFARLDRCPFVGKKPTCARCSIHCYRPEMRRGMVEVMRYAGPRMMHRHPVLTLYHLVDGFRRTPGPR